MGNKRKLLNHFLAALAYRTQKALRDAPEDFGSFRVMDGVRTPAELVRHMTSVLGYARTNFVGGRYWPEPLDSLDEGISPNPSVLTKTGPKHHLAGKDKPQKGTKIIIIELQLSNP